MNNIHTIKIGYRSYKLQRMTKIEAEREASWGQCDCQEGIIRIFPNHDDKVTANTLLHEMLHAIHHEWHINDGDNEENIVTKFANGITTLFNDNPDLIRYIAREFIEC
jgi:hypothetical protein